MNGNTGIVPKLRFPEFRDAGEWNEKELTKFTACGLSNGVFNDPKKVGTGYKLINVLDMYIDTVIDEKKLNLIELSKDEFIKNKVETGDIFFTRSSLVKSGIAYSNIYLGNSNDITFDGHLIRFRPNKIILSPIFANYLLRTYRVRRQLVARGKTATMTTIGQADVSSIKLSIPNLDEQQKISDCLSSLDELITVQTQKIDGLKTHKKGLMQQLFPAEGETLPKLRFPEFQDAGEWEEKPLESICSSISSGKDKSDANGTYDLYGSTGVIGKTSSNTFAGNFILAARVGANAGLLTRATGKFGVTDNTLVIFLKKSEKIDFIYYSLDRLGLNKMVFGSGQPLITGRQLKNLGINLPSPKEQQKIADCLSSIDDLIAAVSQKIDALKNHKKGLMQQLFPSADEVAG